MRAPGTALSTSLCVLTSQLEPGAVPLYRYRVPAAAGHTVVPLLVLRSGGRYQQAVVGQDRVPTGGGGWDTKGQVRPSPHGFTLRYRVSYDVRTRSNTPTDIYRGN